MSKTHKKIPPMPKTPEELEEMRQHLEAIDRAGAEERVKKIEDDLVKKYVGKCIVIHNSKSRKHVLFVKKVEVYEAESENYGITGSVTVDQAVVTDEDTASVIVGYDIQLDSSEWGIVRHMTLKNSDTFFKVLALVKGIIAKKAGKVVKTT